MDDQKNTDYYIISMLESYLNKAKNNLLSENEKIQLMNLFIETNIDGMIQKDEEDWIKYAFLGYWIYTNLENN